MTDLAENAERALRMVREASLLSYDVETTGLDWKIHSTVGYVIGAPGNGTLRLDDVVYVPVRHGGGGNLPGARPMETPTKGFMLHPWEQDLAAAFRNRARGRVIGHNLKFDVHFSANAGVMLGRNLACTQNQEAMLDEYARSYSLEACAEKHGVTAKRGEELYRHLATIFGGAAERNQMANFWRLPGTDSIAYNYAVGDGVTTYELYLKQREQIAEEEMELVAALENDLIWTVFRMERRGIKIDLDRVAMLRSATEARIRKMLEDFPLGFNVRSPIAMRKAMEEAGYTSWPKTDKGNPSFTERWLKKNPLGQSVIAIRQASNLINSFVNPLEEKHVFKGRVHATLNQLKSDDKGTISGRFSCNDPNLQQVPKRVKDVAKPFRRLFVADEGHVFWERDASQCEPRLFAHYSQDPSLLAGYNAEPFVDAHQVVADLLGVERDPTAKRMNMGIFTGMQVSAFAGHMGWDEQRASEAWHAWFQAFPGVRDFQQRAKLRLANRGYVKTLLGRRCRLEEKRFAYRGTSKIIQGSNADIIKWKLLEADRACEDNGDIVQVLMTVHDSFNGQFQDTPQARALFDDIMVQMAKVQEDPFNLTVPFEWEGGEGGDWCEATFGAEKEDVLNV
jgi:DNA polymerase-1